MDLKIGEREHDLNYKYLIKKSIAQGEVWCRICGKDASSAERKFRVECAVIKAGSNHCSIQI